MGGGAPTKTSQTRLKTPSTSTKTLGSRKTCHPTRSTASRTERVGVGHGVERPDLHRAPPLAGGLDEAPVQGGVLRAHAKPRKPVTMI